MFTSKDLGALLYFFFVTLKTVGTILIIGMAIFASFLLYLARPQWVKKRIWLLPIPGLVVLVVFLVIPYFLQKERDEQELQRLQQVRAEREAWRKRYYEPAKARFDQLCQNAGEKIYRTADNVDGILLLKVRGDDEKYLSNNNPRKDQMWEDAAMESDSGREAYISEFLPSSTRSFPRYAYVDVLQKDNSIIRYSTHREKRDWIIDTQPNPHPRARYAVTHENDVSWENRKHWIAGTTIKVIDTRTNELMAEKTMYVFVPALGYSELEQNPNPWGRGERCPMESPFEQQAVTFVSKALSPSQIPSPLEDEE